MRLPLSTFFAFTPPAPAPTPAPAAPRSASPRLQAPAPSPHWRQPHAHSQFPVPCHWGHHPQCHCHCHYLRLRPPVVGLLRRGWLWKGGGDHPGCLGGPPYFGLVLLPLGVAARFSWLVAATLHRLHAPAKSNILIITLLILYCTVHPAHFGLVLLSLGVARQILLARGRHVAQAAQTRK